jgi:AcrR family transcriptional regulator
MDDRKTREDWLRAGLQALAEDGADGLRVMSVARRLNVTKGSFYWHFAGLDAYLGELAQYWERSHTQDAIACVEQLGGDAQTKLRHWLKGAAASDLALDRAIRSWALTHPPAREVQLRVDGQRTDYLITLLRGAGRNKAEAATLGRWSYWAFIGYSTLEGATVTEKEIDLILSVLIPGA